MTNTTPASENPLEHAISQLRDLCGDNPHLSEPFYAGSLGRMIVHMANINQAVRTSTRDHVNASKRLNDFAVTLTRIGKHFEPQDAQLAQRLTSVADTLQAAGKELRDNDSVPAWQGQAVG